jgi:Protein of unknown function (DUF3810)
MLDVAPSPPAYPDDRRIRWPAPLALAAAAALSWGASRLLSLRPDLAEAWAAGPGPALSRPLSIVTGLLPFALGELLLIAWLAWLLVRLVKAIRRTALKQLSWRNALAGGIARITRDASCIIIAFYLLWGLNYARPPIEARLGWADWSGVQTDELAALTEQAIEWTNRTYEALHGSKDAGAPTPLPDDWSRVERSIDAGWTGIVQLLDLPPSEGRHYGRIKRPLASPIIASFGIVGMYFPFTAEANVVRGLPAVRLVSAAAHEKAHQRGIANEAEATFLGYLAAAVATDPLSQYGAAFAAHTQLGSALAAADRDAWQRLAAMRDPGVVRDLRDLAAYYARYSGPANNVGRAVNDGYLRANRVPGGVHNYGRSVRLLIAFARHNGGRLAPGEPVTTDGTSRTGTPGSK